MTNFSLWRFLFIVFVFSIDYVYPLKSSTPSSTQDKQPEEPKNPGPPLTEADFHLGEILPKIPPNMSVKNFLKMTDEEEGKGPKINQKSGLAKLSYHWTNGVVPYTISASFSNDERGIIAAGMKHIEDTTCIRFVPRSNEYDYIDITPGDGGCYAYLPTFSGKKEIGLQQNGCMYHKIVVHELLHILGVKHEQSRPDRDNYVTIDWSNNEDPSQYYKDAWVGTDPAQLLPKCSEAGADLDNCWSGHLVDACGEPYDYKSVMHYALSSFAINNDNPVMTTIPDDVEVGNTEMSSLDITKLKCLYQCDDLEYSNCGGHRMGTTGTMDGSGDSGCEWLIQAEGTGVEVVIYSTYFSVGDCSTDYLEVRLAETSGLVGKYCAGNNPPATLHTKAARVWVTYKKTDGATNFQATWAAEEITCCPLLMMENFGQYGQHLMGPYLQGSNEKFGFPVYENAQSDGTTDYLWNDGSKGWKIGSDWTGTSYSIMNEATTACPEDAGASPWIAYNWDNGEMEVDENGAVRCSDCTKFPTEEECLTCCTTVELTGTSDGTFITSGYKTFAGTYTLYTSNPTLNNRNVYKQDGSDYCLYYSINAWRIIDCSNIGSGSFYVKSSDTSKKCPHGGDLVWQYSSTQDTTMKYSCTTECTGDPPTSPPMATNDWIGGSLTPGTIVTYTCSSSGNIAKAICDASTLKWLPSDISQDLCNGDTTIPSGTNNSITPPTAAPTTAANNLCPVEDGILQLKPTHKIKKIEIEDCQIQCLDLGSPYFQFKKGKKSLGFCFCLSLKTKKKSKNSWGPTSCTT